MRRTFLALASLTFAAPAFAAPAVIAKPAGSWVASSEGGLCRMQRDFEADGQPHLLILEQNAPGQALGIAMAGPSLASLSAEAPLRVNFAAGDAGFDKKALIEPNRQFGHVAILNGVWLTREAPSDDAAVNGADRARIDQQAAKGVEQIAVSQGDGGVVFETGSLADAAQALNECTAQILRSWGLDPEVQYGLRQGAYTEQVKVTYPRMAARYLRSGPVDVVAIIDAAGKAKSCRIINSSGHEELDTAACSAMTKARYRPALDASDTPVASFWTTRISFAATQFEAERIKS